MFWPTSQTAKLNISYLYFTFYPVFRTHLHRPHGIYAFGVLLHFDFGHFPNVLEESSLAPMTHTMVYADIFLDFLHPAGELLKGLVAVDGVDKQNSRYPFVERAHDGSEGLLANLNEGESTVSHICILMVVFSLILTCLV